MAKTLVAIMVSGASAYQLRAPLTHADATRGRSARMGGFEQKLLPLTDDVEARVSLQLSGAAELLEPVTASCRKVASSASLTGIMYAIERLNKLEVIAEGGRESLEELVKIAESAPGVMVKVAWQAPVGGYTSEFSLVTLKPKMSASLELAGTDQCLNYYSRHLNIEAVFNRGLKVASTRPSGGLLRIDVSGDSGRLKSFVRWAQRGPPLQRCDSVDVKWSN